MNIGPNLDDILDTIEELDRFSSIEVKAIINKSKKIEEFELSPLFNTLNKIELPKSKNVKGPIQKWKENFVIEVENLSGYFVGHITFKKLLDLVENSPDDVIIKLSSISFDISYI